MVQGTGQQAAIKEIKLPAGGGRRSVRSELIPDRSVVEALRLRISQKAGDDSRFADDVRSSAFLTQSSPGISQCGARRPSAAPYGPGPCQGPRPAWRADRRSQRSLATDGRRAGPGPGPGARCQARQEGRVGMGDRTKPGQVRPGSGPGRAGMTCALAQLPRRDQAVGELRHGPGQMTLGRAGAGRQDASRRSAWC